jgi:xanthine dehydrogenase YagS FAD-binding subunit
MRPLTYTRAADVDEAIALVSGDPKGAFLAGGTTEVDLVRAGVAHDDHLVDVNDLPLAQVEARPDGGLRIGALARMSDVARAPGVVERFPAISQALLLGASEQLRNMASMGGNLCQRTRCAYLRDGVSPCNKRDPGSGCAALSGFSRGHAVLGTSEHCIATHPSDVAVALVAFDAVVRTLGPGGARAIPADDFFLLPGTTPEREHPLDHGELIVCIDVPAAPIARRSVYLKFRDRQSYEFALVSAAAAVEVEGGIVTAARLAFGGVGTKPWRARRAEGALVGGPADPEAFRRAAAWEMEAAVVRRHNAFKVELAERAAARALVRSLEGGPEGPGGPNGRAGPDGPDASREGRDGTEGPR